MNKIALFMILFLIIPIAKADLIYQGDEVKYGQWEFTFISVLDNQTIQILFEDGLYYEINKTKDIEGLRITVQSTIFDPAYKNGVAEINGQVLWENECYNDTDCNDGNPCTDDYCLGYEKKCIHTPITKCKSGDNCCPENCDYYKDNDCRYYNCEKDSDCDDNVIETLDKCIKNICENTLITYCKTGDDVCPEGCFFSFDKNDLNADRDCSSQNLCISNSDCDDGNINTSDYCFAYPSTNQKKCINILNKTESSKKNIQEQTNTSISKSTSEEPNKVFHEEKCNIKGDTKNEEKKPYYCNGYVWKIQKTANTPCIENYECISGKCDNSRCTNPSISFQEKIKGSWLKYITIIIVSFILIAYAILYINVFKKLK